MLISLINTYDEVYDQQHESGRSRWPAHPHVYHMQKSRIRDSLGAISIVLCPGEGRNTQPENIMCLAMVILGVEALKKAPPINSLCLMERGCGTHLITFPVASALCVTWGVSCPSLADSYFSQQQKKEASSHLICRSLMRSQGDTSKEADILK